MGLSPRRGHPYQIIVARLLRYIPSTANISLKLFGINITINLPDDLTPAERLLPLEERELLDPTLANPIVVEFIDEMVADLKKDYPDITFYKTGVILMNGAFSEASNEAPPWRRQ